MISIPTASGDANTTASASVSSSGQSPSEEFRRYASEKAITAQMYHDSWSEALRAFNAAGSLLYFVLDSSGAIRFEYTSLERVLAEAVTLVPPVRVSGRSE